MSHAVEQAYPVVMHILLMLTVDCLPGLACMTSVSEILIIALALGTATPSCWPDVCDCESVLVAGSPDVACRYINPVCVCIHCMGV